MVEVTDGIYVRFGLQQEPTTENQGRIANVGFILGRQRVAVIDTGNSLVEGLDLRAAIRRVTHLPIAYVIFTHMHPDHVLGAAAFVQDDPEFIGHVQLADALTRREPFYLEAARQLLGDDFEGTRVVLPGSPVSGSRKLDLGGRIIELEAHPTAHTNNDLTVYDPASGTLWLSDLLFIGRIPVIDGSILGWLRQMERLSARDIGLVVPGHGPVTHRWMDALAAQRRYLKKVVTGIREVIRNNGSITQAVSQVANGERENWLLFEENHGRNVTTSFVEIEWE
ncbi:MAG: quinoprotein relay system zinc metallohydrolase 2 [Gammaproteobacteria bacterium]|nr:quinoprotein relay system zinc metallohydrolase 2 [Gammaproteobacteria bacterium]